MLCLGDGRHKLSNENHAKFPHNFRIFAKARKLLCKRNQREKRTVTVTTMSNHPHSKDPPYYGPPPPPRPPYPMHQPPPHQHTGHPGHVPPIPHPQSYHPTHTTDPASPYRGSYPGPVPPSFHNLYSSHSDFHSSSFESHGSSSNGASNGGAPGPYVGFHPYNQNHFPPPPGFYYPWSPPVEYITDPLPHDVLSGRGGATNSHCKLKF